MINFLSTAHTAHCKGLDQGFDKILPDTISTVVTILKVAIPIIIVIFGILDLSKAVMANEEKEMKTAQKNLIKRIVYGVVVFFVFSLVQFIFGRFSEATDQSYNDDATVIRSHSCLDCFINGKCD